MWPRAPFCISIRRCRFVQEDFKRVRASPDLACVGTSAASDGPDHDLGNVWSSALQTVPFPASGT
jgi:hypothetical protein